MIETLVTLSDDNSDAVAAANASRWFAQYGLRERALKQIERAAEINARKPDPDGANRYHEYLSTAYMHLGDVARAIFHAIQPEDADERAANLARIAVYCFEHGVNRNKAIDEALAALR